MINISNISAELRMIETGVIMGGFKAAAVQLSDRQHTLLKSMAHRRTNTVNLVQRANIALLAATGLNNSQIKQKAFCSLSTVKKWRQRWINAYAQLQEIEATAPAHLSHAIEDVLSDETRSGSPPKFTEEQVAQIISLSCETPESCGIPVSHWTAETLAQAAIHRNIVESISLSHIGRFLKRKQKS